MDMDKVFLIFMIWLITAATYLVIDDWQDVFPATAAFVGTIAVVCSD